MRSLSFGQCTALFFCFIAVCLNALYYGIEYGHDALCDWKSTNVLLLTAHPDDECMFFGPTVLALTENYHGIKQDPEHQHSVFSMCLSSGDADGLGAIRKKELNASLDVLGVDKDRRWVLDKLYVS